MKPRKLAWQAHRWLGLVVCLQLLAWSTGGLIFSVLEIGMVRGDRDSTGSPPIALNADDAPDVLHAFLAESGEEIGSVTLIDRGLGAAWEVRGTDGQRLARLDPATGERLPLLTEDEAVRIAQADFVHEAAVADARLIEGDAPTEYRGGPTPAWRIDLDHPAHPHYYINAVTGEIHARRNDAWRVFDFFWMLHVMDYDGRDDFNHPLLTGFSVLAALTAGSGIALWVWRWLGRLRKLAPAA